MIFVHYVHSVNAKKIVHLSLPKTEPCWTPWVHQGAISAGGKIFLKSCKPGTVQWIRITKKDNETYRFCDLIPTGYHSEQDHGENSTWNGREDHCV